MNVSNACINKNNCSLSLNHAKRDFSNINSNILQKEYSIRNKLRVSDNDLSRSHSNYDINKSLNISNHFIAKSQDFNNFNNIRDERDRVISQNKLYRINSLYNK